MYKPIVNLGLANRKTMHNGKETRMETSDAIRNRDLIRHLIQQSSASVGLLSASREIRENEPCSRHFEKWSIEGCPSDPSAEEKVCLDGIGRNSIFCTGMFAVKSLDGSLSPVTVDVTAIAFVDRVMSILDARYVRHGDTHLTFSFDTTIIRYVFKQELTHTTLAVFDDTVPFPGYPCNITQAEARDSLTPLLVSPGNVRLPCPEHTTLVMPRVFSVRVARYDDDGENWLLLTATRR